MELMDRVLMLEGEMCRIDELEEKIAFLENMLRAMRDLMDHGFDRHYPAIQELHLEFDFGIEQLCSQLHY